MTTIAGANDPRKSRPKGCLHQLLVLGAIIVAALSALLVAALVYDECLTRSIRPIVMSHTLNRRVELRGYKSPDFIFGIDRTRYEITIRNADQVRLTDCRIEVDGTYVCKLSSLRESGSDDLAPGRRVTLYWSLDMSNARRFVGPGGELHAQTCVPKTVRLICREGDIAWKLK